MNLLTATNLSFAYRDRAALRGVSVRLDAGEVVAVIGPNGSGKSTLLRALLGHVPASGEVAWDGRPVRDWPPRELSRTVAYLPQSPAADGGLTVLDVLRLGRSPYLGAFGIESPDDDRAVRDVAARLDLVDLLPRRMDELSGGQRQRAFVGRCLAQQPRALLLDEPNTFLDLRHAVELSTLVRSLARGQGLGILLAVHDLNLAAAVADRLVLLDDGAVASDGPAENVLDEALLSRVYRTPVRRVPGDSPAVLPVYG